MTEILFNVINTTYTPFVEMGPLYAIAAVSITISLILALHTNSLRTRAR